MYPFIFSYSQENKIIDSLKLQSKTLKDTSLIKVYNELSWYYKNSNIDSAWFYAKKSEIKSLKIKHKRSLARSYNSLGSVFEAKSNTDSALYYHKKSLAIKESINDSLGAADSYNNIGILYDIKGNYLEALNNYFKSLKIYENNPSADFDKAPAVLVNIGIVYKKQKQYNKVLHYYNRALDIYKENNFEIGVAITTANIGSTLLQLGKYEKSIEYSKTAKEKYIKLKLNRYIPYTEENMGIAYDSIKQHSLAKKLYKNAIQQFNKDENLYELSNTKIALGNSYIKTKNYTLANKELTEALKISSEKEYNELRVKAYKFLSKNDALRNNINSAFSNYKKYSQLKDSLFETKKTEVILELETKYQTAKKEQEIAKQKEVLLSKELALKNRNLIAILSASAFLILGIISFSFYKRNQLKRKQLEKEIELKDTLATIQTKNRLQEQRLRISRDLHDNIGSQLTFIISSIDNLKYISKDLNQTIQNKLTNISNFTGDTIFQLRDTIWAMNKNQISLEDLQTRILSFIDKAKVAKPDINFVTTSNIKNDVLFTSIEGINIFRVIQEAINNSLKYAEANKIEVDATENSNNILITIKDNGKGFDIKTAEMGNGLSNMEKRMSEINGEVFINSEVEKGTTIKIKVPHKNTANAV